jgi:heme oxygenase
MTETPLLLPRRAHAPETIRDRLRHHTREVHERVEHRLDMVGRLADPHGRVPLLRRLWGLHEGAESVLAPALADVPGLDYPARRKAAILAADIARLSGVTPLEIGPVCRFPPLSRGTALGLAYVIEGSALGGLMIFRELCARGVPVDSLSFFNAGGSATGARWRGFIAVLERESEAGGDAMAAEIVAGGMMGFARTETWLCDGVDA